MPLSRSSALFGLATSRHSVLLGLATARHLSTSSAVARGTNLYARLGVSPKATKAEIRERWLDIARASHPDTAPSGHDADTGKSDDMLERFRLGLEAYEVLSDDAKRTKYDKGTGYGDAPDEEVRKWTRGRRANGTAAPSPAEELSPVEARIRHLVRGGIKGEALRDVPSAVTVWTDAGCSLPLLLFLLCECLQTKQRPDDIATVLELLHGCKAQRPPPSKSTDEAITLFNDRHTQAYNDLIRVCTVAGCTDSVFVVIDEMDKRGIEKNQETLAVLEQMFSYFPESMNGFYG